MNKTWFLPAVLAASLCLTPLTVSAGEYATVKGGGLNLRQTASLEAKVLGQYWTGTWIEILEKGDVWCKVKVNGKEGYMMTKFLNTCAAGSTYYVRTNTGIGLNLRSAPGMDAEIITSFLIDTPVSFLQKGAAWHKVQRGLHEQQIPGCIQGARLHQTAGNPGKGHHEKHQRR